MGGSFFLFLLRGLYPSWDGVLWRLSSTITASILSTVNQPLGCLVNNNTSSLGIPQADQGETQHVYLEQNISAIDHFPPGKTLHSPPIPVPLESRCYNRTIHGKQHPGRPIIEKTPLEKIQKPAQEQSPLPPSPGRCLAPCSRMSRVSPSSLLQKKPSCIITSQVVYL